MTPDGIRYQVKRSKVEYQIIQITAKDTHKDMYEKLAERKRKQCDITHKRSLQLINNAEKMKEVYGNMKWKMRMYHNQSLDHIIQDVNG